MSQLFKRSLGFGYFPHPRPENALLSILKEPACWGREGQSLEQHSAQWCWERGSTCKVETQLWYPSKGRASMGQTSSSSLSNIPYFSMFCDSCKTSFLSSLRAYSCHFIYQFAINQLCWLERLLHTCLICIDFNSTNILHWSSEHLTTQPHRLIFSKDWRSPQWVSDVTMACNMFQKPLPVHSKMQFAPHFTKVKSVITP